MKILVVDDSATVLHVVQAALADDYDVETAADGEEGLRKARRSPPDLIVTDSIMPGLDGFGLLRSLQAEAATREIPAIILTSEDPGHAPVPQDVRASAVITKSMDMSSLLSAIRAALALR
jgi:DNA-binding response OmpR family regulator